MCITHRKCNGKPYYVEGFCLEVVGLSVVLIANRDTENVVYPGQKLIEVIFVEHNNGYCYTVDMDDLRK